MKITNRVYIFKHLKIIGSKNKSIFIICRENLITEINFMISTKFYPTYYSETIIDYSLDIKTVIKMSKRLLILPLDIIFT